MGRKRVILATGGSGGHLFPAESLYLELEKRHEVLFAGGGLSTNRFFDKKYPYCEITATPKIARVDRIARGVKEGVQLIGRFKPDLLVGFGSYHTLPLMAAAILTRTPLVLFMADSIPGRVVRVMAPFAQEVASVFPLAKKKTTLVEMPLRPQLKKRVSRKEALDYYGLDEDIPIWLVVGGSQGAKWINETFSSLYDRDWVGKAALIHITGANVDCDRCREQWMRLPLIKRKRIVVKPFEEKMEMAWSIADIALTRAGAVSLSEQLFYEVPGLAIPFPEAMDNHQEANGLFFEQLGLCKVLRQKEMTSQHLAKELEILFNERNRRVMQIRDARNHYHPKKLVEVVEKYL